MKNKLKKGTLFLTVAVLLNIAFATASVFLVKIMSEKKVALEDLRGKVLETEEKKRGISGLQNLLKNIGAQKREIDNAFIEENRIVDFIESLENVARLAGVKIKFQNAEIPTNSGINNSFPVFLFNVNGSFETIFKFLKLAENLPYQINIRELEFLSENDSKEKSWRANFKIQLLSFIQTSR